MAAEKLTRGRLIQILLLMCVLIAAFTWRTITYAPKGNNEAIAESCNLNAGACTFMNKNDQVAISLITSPVIAEQPILVKVENTSVKPMATAEGSTMNMGVIPVVFSKKGDAWIGKFTVPACTSDSMNWAIKLQISGQEKVVNITVKK